MIVMGNNRTTVLGNYRPANGQPESGAAGAGPGCAALYEFVENAFEFVFRDADALVDDPDDQCRLRSGVLGSAAAGQFGGGNFNADAGRFGRKLDGVGKQVAEDL